MTKLQFFCLKALEEMNLLQLYSTYFAGNGIGYVKRVIAGTANPHEFVQDSMCKRFEQKYHEAYENDLELRKKFSEGW